MTRRSIIVVEDDPGDQTLLQLAYDHCGFAHPLKFFNTGEELLRHIQAPAARTDVEQIALVLVDFNIPGVKGDELIARLRVNPSTRSIPAVMLSGSARDVDIASAYEKGASGYLRKSLDFTEFTDLIRDTVTFWADHNLLPDRSVARPATV